MRTGSALRVGAAAVGVCVLAALAVVVPLPADAACDQSGSTVSCTGTTTNYDAGTQSGITITVQPGATVQGIGGTSAVRLTNPSGISGDTLINNGTIDGLVDITSSNPGTDTFTNNGVLKITDPSTSLTSHSLFGTAFTQSASGTFMARVDAAGFNDSVLVNSATLAGRLMIMVQPGLYTGANIYTVVNSTNPVVGAFDSVSVSSPFFTYSVSNCACSVDVTLTPIAFDAVPGLTSNQQTVARVLQTLYASGTPTGSLATFYSNLFAATSVGVFDQLSGAGAAAAQNAGFAAAGLFGDAMAQQGLAWISGGQGSGFGAPLQYAATAKTANKPGYEAFAAMQPRTPKAPEWRAWALGFGSRRTIDGSGGAADQSMQTAGGAFGIERTFGGDMLFGLAAGASHSNFSASGLSTTGTIDGGHVGAYLGKRWGDVYALASLNYARFDNATDRTVSGVGTTENAHGRFAADQIGGRIELGWRRRIAGYAVTPFVAVEPAALWQHAYTESATTAGGGAGTLGLSYAARETTSLPAFVGAQLDAQYLVGGQTVRPFLRAAWVHEFMPERQIEASLVSIPSATFTVDGARPARDAARISGGATWTIDASKAVLARVDSEFSGSGAMVAGTAGVRISW